MNTLPYGSSDSQSRVRPSAVASHAGASSIRPVSACQSSGVLPFTRSVISASRDSSRPLRTK